MAVLHTYKCDTSYLEPCFVFEAMTALLAVVGVDVAMNALDVTLQPERCLERVRAPVADVVALL